MLEESHSSKKFSVVGSSEKICSTSSDLVSYNQILEGFLNSRAYKPLLTVSNIGDGSFLLKMSMSPFPPLTCLITEREWQKLMGEVALLLYKDDARSIGNSTLPSNEDADNDVAVMKEPFPSHIAVSKFSELSPNECTSFTASEVPHSSRHSLKVRFHRTDTGYQYRVVDAIGDSLIYDHSENLAQRSRRKACKKNSSQSSHHQGQVIGEIAYMIDESAIVESDSIDTSSKFVNDHDSMCVVPYGSTSRQDTTNLAQCSVEKSLNNDNSNCSTTFTWPVNMGNISNHYDESVFTADQLLISHHTWKNKQRRGDPVKITPYVKRQGVPVFANISLSENSDHAGCETIQSETDMLQQVGTLRRRCYSYPPVYASRYFYPCWSTRASPYCGSSIKYNPASSHLSLPDSVLDKGEPNMYAARKEEVNRDSENSRNSEMLSSPITQRSPMEQNNSLENDSSSVTPPASSAMKIKCSLLEKDSSGSTQDRRTTRLKKVRPRAGRRTGERVTADDQPSSSGTSSLRFSKTESSHCSKDEYVDAKSEEAESESQMANVPDGNMEIEEQSSHSASEFYMAEEYDQNMTEAVICRQKDDSANDDYKINVDEESCSRRDISPTMDNQRYLCMTEDEKLFIDNKCNVKIEEVDEYAEEEDEAEISDESMRSESDLSLQSIERNPEPPAKGTLAYRYKMWSDAYKKFRTNPFLNTPEEGQLPQFVRYPPRSTKDVQIVLRNGKPFAKLSGRFEVAVTLPVKAPNARNWKEILVGDLVWCKWRTKEYWPGTVYQITDTAPILVTVFWTNDKTQSTVEYSGVDLFDMAFHLRFDSRRSDQKYLRAVTTALRYMGKMGFWETFLTKKLYDEIVRQAGPAFCLHIGENEIMKILNKRTKPHKQTREWKKEDKVRRQRSEELLQALQASHFITLYNDPPLVGNAFPLTQQIVEDYLGSARYASRNLDPLFEQGTIPFSNDEHVFDIDPEVMGSNEIYHPDENGIVHCVPADQDSMMRNGAPRANRKSNKKKKILTPVDKEEEKPPPMDAFSEIDALGRSQLERPTPKKRSAIHFDTKQTKVKRFY